MWTDLLFLGLTLPPALAWVLAAKDVERLRRALPRLAEARPPSPEAWPRLSVLMPACDEVEHIEASVRALLGSGYPNLELIAVDDRSQDGTGALLDRLAEGEPRLRVVHVEALPEGWLGKVHALHVGAAEAGGDWLLLMDADVQLLPGALERALTWCLDEEVELLTLLPELLPMGLLADAALTAAPALATPAARMWEVADPDSEVYAGFGAFLLLRRAAWDRTEGFAGLALELADDMGVGLQLKAAGARCRIGFGVGLLKLRWYRDFREMSRRMQKNWFGIMGRCRLSRCLGIAAAMVWFGAWPLAALLPLEHEALRALTLLGGLAMHLAHWRLAQPSGVRRPGALLTELGLLATAWVVLRAGVLGAWEGGVRWRGVRYESARLRAAQKVLL
ncbi:MAG: glycosyltransferase [Alphaproteobacteria bacterium]|nr:glycosyltransferase [Alphaproteobacteria bacterium]